MNQDMRIKYNLPVSFIKEGTQVIAYTPALDLSTVGKDEAEARTRFNEAVGMFFSDIIETGSVESVLSELGWQKVEGGWNPPVISQDSLQVSVPAFV